jgi:hypothetical protein
MLWRRFALALAMAIAVFVVAWSEVASAQPRGGSPKPSGAAVSPPGSTPVLSFETDDADEQADAFTAALRAKLKSTPGWTLSDSTFSMGILTAALRCRVDAPCLQRVGEQLKTDKFFWGRVSRLGKTQIVVEAHYWQRSKHDSVVKETYPDDLRDPNNEALKKIAARVFERLTNTLTTGTVTVQAGKSGGSVYVDGAPAAELTGGLANVELKAGPHTLEVRAPGFLPVRRTVNVVIGADTQVTMALAPENPDVPPSPPAENSSPVTTRQILAYSLMGAGVVAGAVGVVFGAQWLSKSSDIDDLRKNQYGIEGAGVTVDDPCSGAPGASPAAAERMNRACELGQDAKPLSTVAWISGGVGAALIGSGVVLLVTGNHAAARERASRAPASTSAQGSWALAPAIGPRAGSLRFDLTF